MTVRAAGAVLLRAGEVCLVHRPAYDDWSLPKGRVEDSELSVAAAVREVREETGVSAEPLIRLTDVCYDLPDGRPKVVQFWLMRPTADATVPVDDPAEVDEVAWLPPDAAVARLTYAEDRALVAQAMALPPVTAVTPMVRHAHAGDRKSWQGNDALRPLDPRGVEESRLVAEAVALFGPQRLFAATPLRCKQTLEPLAAKLGLPIVNDHAFAEPAGKAEIPERVREAVARLAELRAGPPAAICSQGKVMPPLLAELAGGGDPADHRTPKGGGWVIAWSGEAVAGISRLL